MRDRSLQVRAQEIINASPEPITSVKAIERALREMYSDYETLVRATAVLAAASSKAIRQATYTLPDERQGHLFDIPAYIVVMTPEGDLYIPKDQADSDQVLQWGKEALRHHSVQRLRFERVVKEVESLGLEKAVSWTEARKMLEERRQQALEDRDG
jgi:hypothetical protein